MKEEKTNFLQKYVLPRKDYNILSITENRSEFLVEEVYWIFNTSIWHTHHLEDNFLGTPFSDYFSAKEKKKELEKIENKKKIDRELNFIWISVAVLLTVVFLGTFKYL